MAGGSHHRGDILAYDITSLYIVAANEGCIVGTGLTVETDHGYAGLQHPVDSVVDDLDVLIGCHHHQVYDGSLEWAQPVSRQAHNIIRYAICFITISVFTTAKVT